MCWIPPATLEPQERPADAPPSEVIVTFAGRGEFDLAAGRRQISGVTISADDLLFEAESASYTEGDPTIEMVGTVRLQTSQFAIYAEDASFDRANREVTLPVAGFELREESARGEGENLHIGPEQVLSLDDLFFTTCPEDDVDWRLEARSLELDPNTGFGTARGVKLIFKRVPILYAPYFTFPIDDRRKSGFLTPRFAERDRTGLDLTVPYYLNLAPNYDLLLEPRYMSERGPQIGMTFRYLTPGSEGRLRFEALPDDDVIQSSRHYANLQHETLFGNGWQLTTGIEDVSDPSYFEDLGTTLGDISQTHLQRYVDLSYYQPQWTFMTRLQNYQTIDTQIAEDDRPYERLPQLLFHGQWGEELVGFESSNELVNFDRSVGVTGWRFDSTQELSLRFGRPGMYLTPAVGFRQTNYWLDGTEPGIEQSPSRSLPITSLDSGLRFEREAGRQRAWIQTIEPRALYVHVPFEDQSNLPVFDTILPDFNLVQLFRKYQFVGADRMADTDQISFGVTTRLIDAASGREVMSATLGQTRYHDPRQVMLPAETAVSATRSNYVAELGLALSDNWNLDIGYQWDGQTDSTVRAETRFEFRPQDDRLFGVGYRQREGLLEQGDLYMIWPVFDRWRVIGQYSYSLLEKEPLERLAGIEYEACCWLIRLTRGSYIVRSTGETDNTVSIELRLKGLARGGATPEEILGRGILGTRRSDQNPAL
jgi:LPS-assembly protein